MAEEIVSLVDERGLVIGSAPRERVRRENLLHAATAVLVRRSDGRIFVHRRSPSKDWSPSFHDAASGGVLQHGEEPYASALREIREELGIDGVPLRPLLEVLYEDDQVHGYIHCFETTYDGAITFDDGEVVSGDWVTLPQLGTLLADPTWLCVPDTRAVLTALANAGIADYSQLG